MSELNKKLNIGIFTDTYYPHVNGVVTSIKVLETELKSRGHKVYIFTTSNPLVQKQNKINKANKFNKLKSFFYRFSKKNNSELHEKNKIISTEENVFRLPSMPFIFCPTYRIAFSYSPRLLLKIKNFDLDIIHTQTEFSIGIFGKIVSKILRIPMIHTYHTMYEDYVHYVANGYLITPKMAQKFSKIFCNRAKIVIAPTQKTKDSLINYGVKKSIEIIPTGINLEKFSCDNISSQDQENIIKIQAKLNITQDDFIILFLGRVAKEKSIDILIYQMPNIIKKIPNAKLLIVGGGPYLDILKNLAFDLNIDSKIIFTGEISWQKINLYYKLADIFITASTSETQGLTYIEAMASNIPVIAKNDDSIKNLIIHNKTGLIFEHPNQIPDLIYSLKNNSELKELIINNAANIIKKLSANNFADSIENLYIKAINLYKYHKKIRS